MSKLKKLLVTSLSAALLGACIVPVTGAMIKASATENWSKVDIEEEYLVDETLTVPGRTLTIGGETYNATIKMTYPDGSTKIISDGAMSLSVAGEYTITYEVRANGKLHREEEEFLVADKLWSVKNLEKSSVEYGKVGDTEALLVRLAKNDTLTFNKVVDLADYKSSQDLIRCFVNPDAVGSYEFESIIVKVTDAYDPTQVLTVRGYKSSSSVHTVCGSYWTAAGPNQTLAGWDDGAKRYSLRTEIPDGICGTFQLVSFCSQRGWYVNPDFAWEDVTADVENFGVRFDQASKEVYVDAKGATKTVADLDKPEYYATEPLWKGFTSGKVKISVTADAYAGETANFAVSKVFGYDSLNVENRFVEEDAPELTVEVEDKYVEYSESLNRYSFVPLAVVGGKYPVPNATAFDGYSGSVKVTTKAYFDYTNTKQSLTIKDGSFEVKSQGDYAVVYTAKDHMGNEAERIYWVKAVNKLDAPLALTVNNADATLSGVCGEKIALAGYTTAGGSLDKAGESTANVTITATCGDTTLDVSKGVLLAEKAGTWTITYQAKDYAGVTVEKSYEIAITLGDKPVFVDAPLLPKYFISGMEYVVPTVYAYDYTSGSKVEKIADLVLTDANGTKTYKAGEAYTPVVEEGGVFALSFVCESATLPLDVKAVMPRSGENGVYIEKMFITDGLNVTRDKEGLTMTATKDGEAGWTFANALAAEGVSLYVKGIKNYSIFKGMKITFTDYADSNIAVTMYVEHNASGNLQVKFGDTDRELTKGLNLGISNGKPLNDVCFSYKMGKFYVDGLGVNVTLDDNGNAFEGFPSGKVYMSSEVFGVKADQKYLVTQIDNHIIGARARDSATPRIAISGQYGGMFDVRSEYVVTSALASDVIDPNVTCTVTVTRPNGAVMTDVNGLELKDVPADRDYVIKLTEYGQYQVTYTSIDWTEDNKGISTYAVNVFDQKAPKVSLKGAWSDTAKVGDSVVLPEVEISDDHSTTAELSVYRMVRNPYDVLTVFGYDAENVAYRFTFKHAGEYKFIIVVADAAGNQAYLEYVVTVS